MLGRRGDRSIGLGKGAGGGERCDMMGTVGDEGGGDEGSRGGTGDQRGGEGREGVDGTKKEGMGDRGLRSLVLQRGVEGGGGEGRGGDTEGTKGGVGSEGTSPRGRVRGGKLGCRILIRGIFHRARISRINAVYTADIRVLVPVRVTVPVVGRFDESGGSLGLNSTCRALALCCLLCCGWSYSTRTSSATTVQYSYNPPIYTVPVATILVLVRPQAPPPYSPIYTARIFHRPRICSLYSRLYGYKRRIQQPRRKAGEGRE